MATNSWRDADDPRCPECDGSLSATASYCMHCELVGNWWAARQLADAKANG